MPATCLPTAGGCTLYEVGLSWDAIRIPRPLGLAAMAILGTRCGAVLEDPAGCVYYFVPRGSAATWAVAGTKAIGRDSTLAVPPARYTQPPGPHWRVCPGDGDWITDAHALEAALEDCGRTAHRSERTA